MARQIIDCTRWIGVNGQDDGAEALTFECGDSRGDTARLTRVLIPPGAGTYIVGQLHSDIDGLPLSELDIQCFFGEGVIAFDVWWCSLTASPSKPHRSASSISRMNIR